jgi:biotin operon repressor
MPRTPGDAFSDAQVATILAMHTEGCNAETIAKAIGRKTTSVNNRIAKLRKQGFKIPDRRRTG